MGSLTFIIGGARSGKSEYAERLAQQARQPVLFVATAQSLDAEMRGRIAEHRRRRPPEWETLELTEDVGRQIVAKPRRAGVVVLDCLTLLVSNRMLQAAPDLESPDERACRATVQAEIEMLLQAIVDLPAHWLVISNEVGQGVVPEYPAGRLFRDLLGWANKRLAEKADEVIWMVAGIPVPVGQHRAEGKGA